MDTSTPKASGIAPRTRWQGNSLSVPGIVVAGPSENVLPNASPSPVPRETPHFDPILDSLAPKKSAAKELLPLNEGMVELRYVKNRPYSPEIGPHMYEYFASKEKYRIVYDTFTYKGGSTSEKERRLPNPPPHFSEYARSIGTTWVQIKAWAKEHREFAEYYDACVDIIEEFFVDNGVTGAYAGQFSVFAAKNRTRFTDVQINKNLNANMKDVLDALEKGAKTIDAHDA